MKTLTAGIILIVLFGCSYNASAEVTIEASVDKNSLKQNEALVFTIKISGDIASSPKINLPDINKDFAVLSTSQSQSVSLQNKETALAINFQYILLPKREGKLNIGSVEAMYGKEVYKTDPIEIEVLPAEQISVPESPQKAIPELDEEGTII
jgi:hypothetical protein